MRRDRREAQRHGHAAERLARWWLRLTGWRIIAQDWRVPVGEIDIIARRGRVLVAVEVKARASLAEAAEALRPTQERRMRRAFEAFRGTRPDLIGLDPRLDLILIAPGHWPRHLKGVSTGFSRDGRARHD